MKYRPRTSLIVLLMPFFVMMNCVVSAKEPRTYSADRDKIVVGMLEDINGYWMGKSEYRAVRLVFEKDGTVWKPIPINDHIQTELESLAKIYPSGMRLTIAFDGRSLGTVSTKPLETFGFFGNIETDNIITSKGVPTVGKKSMKYSGFPSKPVYRPLVAVSQPYFSDPDGWKRSSPSAEQVVLAREQFQNKFPRVNNCRNSTENLLRPWHYRDEDIVVNEAYSSKKRSLLIELSLSGYACDGPLEDGGAFDGQWYLIDPSGAVKFIGSGMQLVDAGDYDNDGESEIIFAINAYNAGGYRLFYQNFQKSAEYIFHYE
ncbi:MAG: hypothetical protein WAM79_01700 [Candidatus Sulfotelmatobacter sp.]